MSTSVDVEMVRPALGDGGIYGIEGAGVPDKWAWRMGLLAQYEQSPVQILTDDDITGTPVSERAGGWAGFSLGLGKGVAGHVFIPLYFQAGDDHPLAADGSGLGDPRLGARWAFFKSPLIDTTARADLYVPLGRRDAWMGEETARVAAGVTGALKGGIGAIVFDGGLVMRPLQSPQPGLDWGPTAEFGLGLRANLAPSLSVGAGWIARAVLAGLDERDGELASEALASARWQASSLTAFTAGGGLGVQPGVGAPTWRAFAGVTFSEEPEAKPDVTLVAEVKPPPDPQKILVEELPNLDVPPPPPPPVVAIQGDELHFREEIRFAPMSADLLPESRETLVATAELLAGDGRIAHVTIEGHAADAGNDLRVNWELSDQRARVVWETLLMEGVSPERMSHRGVGDVLPDPAGKTAAAERRVVLKIARRLTKDEKLPDTPATTSVPWTGDVVALDTVSIPAPPPPPPTDMVDPNAFKNDGDEE